GGGNDLIDGGAGSDTMVFTGARSDYVITEVGGKEGGFIVEHLNGGADGISQVTNVETFQFTDGQFSESNMLETNPTSGYDNLTYDISIETGLSDTDGSESLSDVTVSGIPDGATFSAGTDNGDGTWTMTEGDLNGLTLDVDSAVSQDFSITVSVTSTEASNGDAATSTSTIDVALPDAADNGSDITGDTSADALDPLSEMFSDSDTLTFEGEEYDISTLTDGDSQDSYGDVAPVGAKQEIDGYDAADNDTSDGYSSTADVGDGGPVDDIN
ncbi:MAG: hypothetical protein JKY92_10495, partial [Magnetovibrio sp.]|nr:hypothetical protein [Magnetovibrio sp.]